MQVAQHNDHITHAVIGGKQSIEFGISNSAEFFNILSSTLYKDQILAVVREVLCNAWDAHIEAGCTDRPVQVTLTEELFTIKDFGKGIHQDDMGLIYGTYGNSTKKNDGKQTGGFGLGCKAPFAYTDHFDVTSAHDGIRTIYNLSKSSAQAMGKPGITPIASFPSTDSGLTVSIRIQPTDFRRFKELIRRIAHNGDMNMSLNGEQINTLDFDVSKGNFLIIQRMALDTPHRILVRYGNVIYPAEADKNEGAYNAIRNHLDTLQGRNAPYSIIFQAPPHSISVTPSRESLSMQDHTVNTLGKLFKGFRNSLENEFKAACTKYTEAVTHQAVAEKRVDELLKREEALPVMDKKTAHLRIADFDAMAQTYLQHNYPEGLAYRKQDVTRRLEVMVQSNLLDRGKVQTFLRELNEVRKDCPQLGGWRMTHEATSWLQRRVLAPLLRKLGAASLPVHQLYTSCSEDRTWQDNKRDNMPPLVPATKSAPFHLLTTLPYLRNIVVITTRRAELVERAYRHEVFRAAGRYQGYLVYIVGRRKGELEAARQFFTKEGMRVADLTVQEEAEVATRAKPATPRKPAKKGIASLSSILRGNGIHTPLCQKDDAARITEPEFVLHVTFRSGTDLANLGRWGDADSVRLARLFGDKGGITNSTSTYDKWREKGAMAFDDYVRDKICSYVRNNPRIAAYWAYQSAAGKEAGNKGGLVRLIYANATLSQEFGLSTSLPDEDKLYLALWQGLTQQYSTYTNHPDVSPVQDWLNAIPVAPAAEDLLRKLQSPLFDLLDVPQLRYMLAPGKSPDLPGIVALLKTILK